MAYRANPLIKLTLPAPAKLNLFLHITGRRPDGYHNLQTLFQLLDYGDELTFDHSDSAAIRFSCNNSLLETEDNLVVKAARLLQTTLGIKHGCVIHLDKKLPTGGGVGGGSSDAATTLLALNRLWQGEQSAVQLQQLGLQLGADVPVFLHGHTAWAEGVGENLQNMDLPESWFVVITPHCHVATSQIFGHQQLTRNSAAIRIPAFPFSGSRNDCEKVVCSLYPQVQSALDWLGKFAEARMSGTGASVFASFANREQAEAVLEQLPLDFTGFIAQGVNRSPLHEKLEDLKTC
ncbi:MAG: 4-(cytidine 5'-diphospho)-2-C-methyl-D-erythritol kinase [Pseudomonadota bacterium]